MRRTRASRAAHRGVIVPSARVGGTRRGRNASLSATRQTPRGEARRRRRRRETEAEDRVERVEVTNGARRDESRALANATKRRRRRGLPRWERAMKISRQRRVLRRQVLRPSVRGRSCAFPKSTAVASNEEFAYRRFMQAKLFHVARSEIWRLGQSKSFKSSRWRSPTKSKVSVRPGQYTYRQGPARSSWKIRSL